MRLSPYSDFLWTADQQQAKEEYAMVKNAFIAVAAAFLLLFGSYPAPAQDGGPADLGPTDVHEVVPKEQNQKVLVIYVQAYDHRILTGDLANVNNMEDKKIQDTKKWFEETSWNQCTFNFTQKRAAADAWYLLPQGILDYASPSAIPPMEARDPNQASSSNPTPPALVTAQTASDPASDFDSNTAVLYRYAVSGFKNGVESTLTKVSKPVNVSAGNIVKLTITPTPGNDVARYLVYRTDKVQPDSIGNYHRIGYAEVNGASAQYVDTGSRLKSIVSHHTELLTAAMTAASTDVGDYENYDGVIVILYSSFLRGQAAPPMTYTVADKQLKIETIIQSSATPFGRFCHEMGHWIGLPDEYGAVTGTSIGKWTTMCNSKNGQYCGWEKDHKLSWTPDSTSVKQLARPAAGQPDIDQTFKILPTAVEDVQNDVYTSIKIKSSDTVHLYVEGRDHLGKNVSDTFADHDIVVTEAVDAWSVGILPKRNVMLLKEMKAGSPPYKHDLATEVTFTGSNPGPPETYNVKIKLSAQPQPDPKITPWGAPPWKTDDIWVDSGREGGGFDDPNTAVPKVGHGEAAWVNHVNRVYAKISNVGGGDAKNVQVHFRVNTPGGIGAAGQFVDLPKPATIDIPANSSKAVYAEWTPTVASHTCIQVEIDQIPGETDIHNNFAQENVTHFYSGSNSPWQPIKFPVQVANPFEEPRKVELEIDGLQSGWRAKFDHKWVMVEPLGFKTVNVEILPPSNATECTELKLDLYGLIRIDDYIQVYGGINPIVHLANPIRFMDLEVEELPTEERGEMPWFQIRGTTQPAIAEGEEVAIMLKNAGNERVVFAETDGTGDFSAGTTLEAGRWTAQIYYAGDGDEDGDGDGDGDECHAPTESELIDFEVPPREARAWSIHYGVVQPLGALRGSMGGSGQTVNFDYVQRISRRLAWDLRLGLSLFDGKRYVPDLELWTLGANLKYTFNPNAPLRLFVNGGAGLYYFDSGDLEGGGNIGLGLAATVASGLTAEATYNNHRIFTLTPDLEYRQFQLGLLFTF